MSDYANIGPSELADAVKILRGRAFLGLLTDAFSSSDTTVLDAVEAAGRLRINEDEVRDMIASGMPDSFSMPLAIAATEIVAQSAYEVRSLPTPFASVAEVSLAWQTLHLYEEECLYLETHLIALIDDLDALVAKHPTPPAPAYPGELWEIGAATRASCICVAGMIDSAPLMRKCLSGLRPDWIRTQAMAFHVPEQRLAEDLGVGKDHQTVQIAPMFWAVAFSSARALDAALELFPDALDDCVLIGALRGESRKASAWEYLRLLDSKRSIDPNFFATWIRRQKGTDGQMRAPAAAIFSNYIEGMLSPAGWPHLVEPAIDLGLYENPSAASIEQALLSGNSEVISHVIERGHFSLPPLEPVTLDTGIVVNGYGRGHPLRSLTWALCNDPRARFAEIEITLCMVIDHIVRTGDKEQIQALATGWQDDGETLQNVCAFHGMRATLRLLCEHGLDPSLEGLIETAESREHFKLASELRSLAAHMACDQILLEFMQNDGASPRGEVPNANTIAKSSGN